MSGKFFKWTIEIGVHETWVEDGFDLTEEQDIINMLQDRLPFAYGHELKAKILKKPDPKIIRKMQGYLE